MRLRRYRPSPTPPSGRRCAVRGDCVWSAYHAGQWLGTYVDIFIDCVDGAPALAAVSPVATPLQRRRPDTRRRPGTRHHAPDTRRQTPDTRPWMYAGRDNGVWSSCNVRQASCTGGTTHTGRVRGAPAEAAVSSSCSVSSPTGTCRQTTQVFVIGGGGHCGWVRVGAIGVAPATATIDTAGVDPRTPWPGGAAHGQRHSCRVCTCRRAVSRAGSLRRSLHTRPSAHPGCG